MKKYLLLLSVLLILFNSCGSKDTLQIAPAITMESTDLIMMGIDTQKMLSMDFWDEGLASVIDGINRLPDDCKEPLENPVPVFNANPNGSLKIEIHRADGTLHRITLAETENGMGALLYAIEDVFNGTQTIAGRFCFTDTAVLQIYRDFIAQEFPAA